MCGIGICVAVAGGVGICANSALLIFPEYEMSVLVSDTELSSFFCSAFIFKPNDQHVVALDVKPNLPDGTGIPDLSARETNH
jgi:hypothetical protein